MRFFWNKDKEISMQKELENLRAENYQLKQFLKNAADHEPQETQKQDFEEIANQIQQCKYLAFKINTEEIRFGGPNQHYASMMLLQELQKTLKEVSAQLSSHLQNNFRHTQKQVDE